MRKRLKYQRRESNRLGRLFLVYYHHKVDELTQREKQSGFSDIAILMRYKERTQAALSYARSQFATPELAELAFQQADRLVRERIG